MRRRRQNAREHERDLAGYHIDERLPPAIYGDPLRFRQVLTNLLANGLKFTEEGEVVVELALLDTGRLHVSVRDTGIGIPTKVRARLFNAFAQADGSTMRNDFSNILTNPNIEMQMFSPPIPANYKVIEPMKHR